jgi:hypothetical protein
MTARATLGVYGVLDIVEGKEPDPTPLNPDGTILSNKSTNASKNREMETKSRTRKGSTVEVTRVSRTP